MNRVQLLVRLLAIRRVLIRHGIGELLAGSALSTTARWLLPASRGGQETAARGVRIRQALEDLGPIFVKFGQSVSTRQDLLPPDVGQELCKLQDEVPPFPAEQALAEVERNFGAPAETVFASFDREALAAASIAQVHAARLHTGEDVVVKVLRPRVSVSGAPRTSTHLSI